MKQDLMSVLARDYGLKIISGGQTGADLAGLRAAQSLGLLTGGAIPAGWKTQRGSQPSLAAFGLTETRSTYYSTRTGVNVRAADVTVVFATNMESAGTKLTLKYCADAKRPAHKIEVVPNAQGFSLKDPSSIDATVVKLAELMKAKQHARPLENFVINVAGNSTSSSSMIFPATFILMLKLLDQLEVAVSMNDPVSDKFCLLARQLQAPNIALELQDNFAYFPNLDPRRVLNNNGELMVIDM